MCSLSICSSDSDLDDKLLEMKQELDSIPPRESFSVSPGPSPLPRRPFDVQMKYHQSPVKVLEEKYR